MQFEKKIYGKFNKNNNGPFILGGDIGGTNTSLGIFGIKDNLPQLLLSFHFKSSELKGLEEAINETLENVAKNHGIKISKACIAVAGVLSSKKDFVKVTNLRWDISKNILLKKTKLKKIELINDFQAVGYGINMLGRKDVATIKKGVNIPKATILVIGAGTGLGKTAMIYDEYSKSYLPLHSEAGHGDFPAQSKEELGLVNFIKIQKKIKQNVSYEQVLSGQGLENVYLFLRKNKKFQATKYTKEIDKSNSKPELISEYKKIDNTCKAVFEMFKKIYAVFARNCALDCLPEGGIYIAGGIAPKNKEIFDKEFVRVFEENYKMHDVLKKIPIHLITNYNAGLLGAGFCGAKCLK